MAQKNIHNLDHVSSHYGIVLLYHSISTTSPGEPENTIHNIPPAWFENHIKALSKHFKLVSLEQLCSTRDKTGLASISFDDGYSNVISNALPVLEHYHVPCTLFLNSITLCGRYNWRDKVRHLIKNRKESDFLSGSKIKFTQGTFYRSSKSPVNNSQTLDEELDRFLGNTEINVYPQHPYLKTQNLIKDHPLVDYGNHTMNHYVLSSLSSKQQLDEISSGKDSLFAIVAENTCGCFSAPFGGSTDINETTFRIVKNMGYHTILMSRQKLQPATAETHQLQVIERFMPRSCNIIEDILHSLNTGSGH